MVKATDGARFLTRTLLLITCTVGLIARTAETFLYTHTKDNDYIRVGRRGRMTRQLNVIQDLILLREKELKKNQQALGVPVPLEFPLEIGDSFNKWVLEPRQSSLAARLHRSESDEEFPSEDFLEDEEMGAQSEGHYP
ncbi:uncharacterized protein LOC106161997 [Lingula anatina]|uniref:Uncharacterized protein LOC106161997 n=1 Tax=Lingula anatina TaxID=7574 RepID=A0A1S3I8E2_LINAN|nr:uncharacterized protein LOC106161997 [Lingula anatina]|eukprot:XP_013394535.1 uncharacterized protein LOC106161997 [Lingula anatina]